MKPIRSSSTGTRFRKAVTSPRSSSPSCSLPNCAKASLKCVDGETRMRKLEGKIALVTGATAGIGLATAWRFVKEGAYVFITGRRQAALDAAAKLMNGSGAAVRADVANLNDLDRLFAQIKRDKGRLDVVYANAGGGSFAPLGGITEEHFDQTFDTNVRGTLFTVQKALPLVPDGGSIIMTSSSAG